MTNIKGEGKDFSFSNIENFDNHISREIRGYKELDTIIKGIAEIAIEDKTNVYDIGCSTGRLIKELDELIKSEKDQARIKNVNFYGIEPNQNFTKDFVTTDTLHFINDKVDDKTVFNNASLITSIFTLQFIPAKHRLEVLSNIYNGLNLNGVFIWAEKVFSKDSQIEQLLTSLHLDFKREGSEAEMIMDKEKRLRAIQRPLTLEKNIRLLEEVGFTQYDSFWRVNNFIGLVAIK
jgi:tRNA (cmo5U34)-methyltransferase